MNPKNNKSNSEKAPNPFDIESLRTPIDYKKSGATDPINLKFRSSLKAPRDKFIRVHDFDIESHDWCFDTLMYKYEAKGTIEKETFIVPAGSEAFGYLQDRLNRFLVVAATTRKGDFFLWELQQPDPDGNRRGLEWHSSKRQCANRAIKDWISVEADMNAGAYKANQPLDSLPEPTWPDVPFNKILDLCYRDRIISDADHHIVKEILGVK